MFGIDIIPGFVMGLREGLEAFLVIVVMIEYLRKTNRTHQERYVKYGLFAGLIVSAVFGLLMYGIAVAIGSSGDTVAKLWEAIVSLIALSLITTFIFFMIQHRNHMSSDIKSKVDKNITNISLFLIALVMVAREGAEIVLFVFTAVDKAPYLIGTILGVVTAVGISYMIFKSLIKVNLKVIFNITLIYLILQAGFLFGYGIHEFISYLKSIGTLSSDSLVYTKMFDLTGTVMDHKEGVLGIPLYALLGWYSKPEIIQFIIQYAYTGSFLIYFYVTRNK